VSDNDEETVEGNLLKLISAIIDEKMKRRRTTRLDKSNGQPRRGRSTKVSRERVKQAATTAGGMEESEVDESKHVDSEMGLSSDHNEDGNLKATTNCLRLEFLQCRRLIMHYLVY
jgi:hypothetical protein